MGFKIFFQIPDLVDLQRTSFLQFLEKNLIEELNNFSPLQKENGEYKLIFQAKNFRLKKPIFSPAEALIRGLSYAAGLYVPVKLINHDWKKWQIRVINNKISAMVNTQTKITKDFFDKYQNLLTETKNPNLLEFFF